MQKQCTDNANTISYSPHKVILQESVAFQLIYINLSRRPSDLSMKEKHVG